MGPGGDAIPAAFHSAVDNWRVHNGVWKPPLWEEDFSVLVRRAVCQWFSVWISLRAWRQENYLVHGHKEKQQISCTIQLLAWAARRLEVAVTHEEADVIMAHHMINEAVAGHTPIACLWWYRRASHSCTSPSCKDKQPTKHSERSNGILW